MTITKSGTKERNDLGFSKIRVHSKTAITPKQKLKLQQSTTLSINTYDINTKNNSSNITTDKTHIRKNSIYFYN